MSIANGSTAFAGLLLLSAAFPTIVDAQSTGLDDMVGARAGQAEGELQRRGYRNVRTEKATFAAMLIGGTPTVASA